MTTSPKGLWLAKAISTNVCLLKAAGLEGNHASSLRETLNIASDKRKISKMFVLLQYQHASKADCACLYVCVHVYESMQAFVRK
jgi:hypothetical protein